MKLTPGLESHSFPFHKIICITWFRFRQPLDFRSKTGLQYLIQPGSWYLTNFEISQCAGVSLPCRKPSWPKWLDTASEALEGIPALAFYPRVTGGSPALGVKVEVSLCLGRAVDHSVCSGVITI